MRAKVIEAKTDGSQNRGDLRREREPRIF